MAEDRKFKFEDGRFINRVSGEAIPDDEPVILFRARDNHAIPTLLAYLDMVQDPHHRQAVMDRLDEFSAYRAAHPDRLKEPGVTRHIVLNKDAPAPEPVKADPAAEGWVLVPREPTEAMIRAMDARSRRDPWPDGKGWDLYILGDHERYAAMISASPPSAAEEA